MNRDYSPSEKAWLKAHKLWPKCWEQNDELTLWKQ